MRILTENALIKRINRKLFGEEQVLRKARAGTRAFEDFGQYYILCLRTNSLVDSFVDLPSLAIALGVGAVMEE